MQLPSCTPRRRAIMVRPIVPACLILTAGLLGADAAETYQAQTFQNDPDRLVMATAHWHSRAQLQKIAARFQHLIIDEKARTARIEASSGDLATLRRMGIRVEIDYAATERMRRSEAAMAERAAVVGKQGATTGGITASPLVAQSAIPGYACYRTVEETYATMDQLAATRPSLASVIDIGPSWTWAKSGGASGYRMRVLRLNNTATDATVPDKPDMVVLSAIHAREYTTAELATRFAQWLANGYGTDHEATWLLDNFRFHFILQGNPDGRKKAESGLSWRKNTDTDNGSCSANAYGVDLNRNFTWRFNTVAGGSSGEPCDSTYRGPAAASEEETQNAMRYIVGTPGSGGTYTGGVLPDRRTDTGTAPADYKGLFLDLHSFSRLVLWPWAYTSTSAPNAVPLRTLGRRLAYFNGYRPEQWTGLYAADGTNTDTVYGITGAPSYTIELGQEFFEDCATFESTTFPQNLSALKYAARNLQQPYDSPSGPDTTSIGASAASIVRGQAFAVSAWVDDGRYNQSNGAEPVQNIATVSAWLDSAPWRAGATALSMHASDGAFDSSREQATININASSLAYGKHVVYVRGTDASGRPGTPSAIYFQVRPNIQVPLRDYDNDGKSDLFWRNSQTGANTIWRSANNATQTAVTGVSSQAWKVVGTGDFDGDGRSDILWRNTQTGANAIWRSANAATQQTVASVTNMAWTIAGVGDFDVDGKSDVFWRNTQTGQNTIWRSANNATQTAVSGVSNQAWKVVGTGDFDGDGRSDVLWRNMQTGANTIWRSANNATQTAVTGVGNLAWKIAGVGDFDGDGVADIFWRNGSTGANTVWRAGNSSRQITTAAASTAWRVASVGDFDNDGAADIMWRNASTGQNQIWRRANSATPQAVATVGSLAWAVVPYENQP